MPSLPYRALVLLAASGLACGSSDSDPIECGPNGECPDGLTCEPVTRRCLRNGTADARGAIDTVLVERPPALSGPVVTFSFTASVAGATFECSLDGAAYESCSSPLTLTALSDGGHRFAVRAVGDASPATHEWTVASAAPVTTILERPAAVTNVTTATVTFVVSPPGSTTECSLDGATFAACTSPRGLSGLAAGAHSLEIRATSPTGIREASPPRVAWEIDLVPPAVTIDAPASGETVGPGATLAYSATESVTRFECSVDGAAFAPCGAGLSGTRGMTLGGGPHEATVRGIDAAGNVGPEARVSFFVDATPPVVTVARTGSCAGDPVIMTPDEVATFVCAIGDRAPAPCTSPLSLPADIMGGTTALVVRATDRVGNTGAPIPFTLDVDRTGPAVTFTGVVPKVDSAGFADATGEITFHSDGTAASVRCALDGGSERVCAERFSYSRLSEDDNPHELVVTARDACGNDGVPGRFTFKVDTTGPTFTLGAIAAAEGSGQITVAYTASEATRERTCTLDGIACASCAATSATCSAVSAGAHLFTVSGVDLHGNRGAGASSGAIVMSYGPGAGHAVLVGHDYLTSSPGADAVLRRAIEQAPFRAFGLFERPLRVAAYRPASVPDEEAENALAAIDDLLDHDVYEDFARAADLADVLPGKDVLLVFDLQDPVAAADAGAAWAPPLRTFLDRGGVVVVLDGLVDGTATPGETYRVLGGGASPILAVSAAARFHDYSQTTARRIDDLNDALHPDDVSPLSVGPSYAAPPSSVVYTLVDGEQPRTVYARVHVAGDTCLLGCDTFVTPTVIDKIFPVYELDIGLGSTIGPRGAIPFSISPATPYARLDCAASGPSGSAACAADGSGFLLPFHTAGRYRIELRLVDEHGRPGRGATSLVEIGLPVVTVTRVPGLRDGFYQTGALCFRGWTADGRALGYRLRVNDFDVPADAARDPRCAAEDSGSYAYRLGEGYTSFIVDATDAWSNAGTASIEWWWFF